MDMFSNNMVDFEVSIGVAAKLGFKLHCALSVITQQELDIFFGRCDDDNNHVEKSSRKVAEEAMKGKEKQDYKKAAAEEEDKEDEILPYEGDTRLHDNLVKKSKSKIKKSYRLSKKH